VTTMEWYALLVQTGQEYLVERQIQKNFGHDIIRSFVPRKLVKERKEGVEHCKEKILYPGYLFICLQMTPSIYHKLTRIPKILYHVRCNRYKNRNSNGYYSVIPLEELDFILRLSGSDGVIGYSYIKLENKQVEVLSGPLHGLESLIINVDIRKSRAKVNLPFMGEAKTINLGVCIG
jgi:transcriptional antiterminator NusG